MGCCASSAASHQWRDYQEEIAKKPRGLDAADADRLMRAAWISYMDPAGLGAVRSTVAPSWMKDTSRNQDEPPPLRLASVLEAGMGGAWPAMEFLTPPDDLKEFFQADGGKLTGYFDHADTCTQAVFAKIRNESDGVHLLLSCRGSTTLEDWSTNAWGMKTRFEPQLDDIGGTGDARCSCGTSTDRQLDQKRKDLNISQQGRVHRGFYEAFLPLRKAIDTLLVKPCMESGTKVKQVTFVGHSLGGALATLSLAYFLLQSKGSAVERGIKVTSFTVGSPRVGDEEFRAFVFKNANGLREKNLFRQYRVVLDRDIVATVPPFRFGYRHQGRLCKIAQCENGSYDKLMFKNGQVDDHHPRAAEMVNLSGHWKPPTYPGADLVGDHQVPQYFANIYAAHKSYMGEFWSYKEKHEKADSQYGGTATGA